MDGCSFLSGTGYFFDDTSTKINLLMVLNRGIVANDREYHGIE
jgi:hypothetical protein